MVSNSKDTDFSVNKSINIKGNLISFDNPLIMGILNITNDSFYDGGKYNTFEYSIKRAEEIISQGADIIDIGACSTRPGAILVDKKEEIKRLVPTIKEIRKRFSNIPISIDTVWSEVVEAVYDAGADIVNDISGGQFDDKLFSTVAKTHMPYILMHTNTTPDKMQKQINYDNILLEMNTYFASRIENLKMLGVNDIILDLGFGFGKTLENNYELLRRQKEFQIFDLPILTGISRKSMIYRPLNQTPKDVLVGTLFLSAFALENGANILRVHDIKTTKDCLTLYKLYKNS